MLMKQVYDLLSYNTNMHILDYCKLDIGSSCGIPYMWCNHVFFLQKHKQCKAQVLVPNYSTNFLMTQVVREEGGFLTHGVWSVIWLSAKGYAQRRPLSTSCVIRRVREGRLHSWPIRHQLLPTWQLENVNKHTMSSHRS